MNEPKLRFSGFYDEWKTSVLKENSTKINDGTHGNSDYRENGNVAFIICNNIKNGKINISKNTPYVTEEQKSNDDKSLNSTSILISTVGTIGNLALYKGENIKLGRSVAYINLNTKLLDKLFCLSYLSRNNIKNYFLKRLTGTSVKNLTLTTLKKTPIISPYLEEQQKIGSFFEKIDQLIKLQSDKLEHLKITKKGYLQKMFNYKKHNNLRFIQFKDRWQLKKIKNLAKINMGQSPNSSEYTKNNSCTILIQGNADLKYGHLYPRIFTKKGNKYSFKNELIFTVRAPVGNIAINQFNKVAIGRGVASINYKYNIFLYYQLNTLKMNNFWNKLSSGTVFESISSNDIKNTIINVPSYLEQQKIGQFFSNLDQQIILQQQKIDNLQQQKKAYLQKMFI